ncbi:MAG: hypothetical protein MJ014_00640 [Methanocorpusculum sp.]|nr:hypothetical protein [Methanocorpusculum sp.]
MLSGGKIGDKNGQAIAGNGYTKIIIYGGTFSGDEALGVKSGEWEIHGGTFTDLVYIMTLRQLQAATLMQLAPQ